MIGYLGITSKPKNSPTQVPTHKVFPKAKHIDIALSNVYSCRWLNATVLCNTTAPKKIIYSELVAVLREILCLLTTLHQVLAVAQSAMVFGERLQSWSTAGRFAACFSPSLLFLLLQPFLCLPLRAAPLCCQGPIIPRGEAKAFHPTETREACPDVQPYKYPWSQREGSSRLQTQGQKALRRWEISQGRSWCQQKSEGNGNICCRWWKKPKQTKPQQGEKRR